MIREEQPFAPAETVVAVGEAPAKMQPWVFPWQRISYYRNFLFLPALDENSSLDADSSAEEQTFKGFCLRLLVLVALGIPLAMAAGMLAELGAGFYGETDDDLIDEIGRIGAGIGGGAEFVFLALPHVITSLQNALAAKINQGRFERSSSFIEFLTGPDTDKITTYILHRTEKDSGTVINLWCGFLLKSTHANASDALAQLIRLGSWGVIKKLTPANKEAVIDKLNDKQKILESLRIRFVFVELTDTESFLKEVAQCQKDFIKNSDFKTAMVLVDCYSKFLENNKNSRFTIPDAARTLLVVSEGETIAVFLIRKKIELSESDLKVDENFANYINTCEQQDLKQLGAEPIKKLITAFEKTGQFVFVTCRLLRLTIEEKSHNETEVSKKIEQKLEKIGEDKQLLAITFPISKSPHGSGADQLFRIARIKQYFAGFGLEVGESNYEKAEKFYEDLKIHYQSSQILMGECYFYCAIYAATTKNWEKFSEYFSSCKQFSDWAGSCFTETHREGYTGYAAHLLEKGEDFKNIVAFLRAIFFKISSPKEFLLQCVNKAIENSSSFNFVPYIKDLNEEVKQGYLSKEGLPKKDLLALFQDVSLIFAKQPLQEIDYEKYVKAQLYFYGLVYQHKSEVAKASAIWLFLANKNDAYSTAANDKIWVEEANRNLIDALLQGSVKFIINDRYNINVSAVPISEKGDKIARAISAFEFVDITDKERLNKIITLLNGNGNADTQSSKSTAQPLPQLKMSLIHFQRFCAYYEKRYKPECIEKLIGLNEQFISEKDLQLLKIQPDKILHFMQEIIKNPAAAAITKKMATFSIWSKSEETVPAQHKQTNQASSSKEEEHDNSPS